MNRASRPLLAAVVAGTLLFGAGCGSAAPAAPADTSAPASAADSAPATSAAGTASPETVAWTNNVCGALQKFTQVASAQPKLDTSSIAASVKSLSDYIGQVTAALDGTIADLKNVGPSPAPGGDAAVQKLTDALGQYRETFQKAKTNIDQSKPTDAGSLQTALAPLADIKNVPNPADGLQASPELEAAAAQAPNCQAFATTPTTTPGG